MRTHGGISSTCPHFAGNRTYIPTLRIHPACGAERGQQGVDSFAGVSAGQARPDADPDAAADAVAGTLLYVALVRQNPAPERIAGPDFSHATPPGPTTCCGRSALKSRHLVSAARVGKPW